jgi:hypothetical protein
LWWAALRAALVPALGDPSLELVRSRVVHGRFETTIAQGSGQL